MPTITKFNGVTLAGAYVVDFSSGTDYSWSSQFSYRDRYNFTPQIDSHSREPWKETLVIRPGASANANRNIWRREAISLFTPHKKDPRVLEATFEGLTLQCLVIIENLTIPSDSNLDATHDNALFAEIVIVENAWRDTVPITSTVSPLAVGGNYEALPTVTYSPVVNIKYKRLTFGDTTGRALYNHTIKSPVFDSSGAGATGQNNYIAFFNGLAIPIFVVAPNTNGSYLFGRVNMPASPGTDHLEVFWGDNIDNPVTGGTFIDGGFDLTDWANDLWTWDADWANLDDNPNVDGGFKIGVTGQLVSGVGSRVSYGDGTVTITIGSGVEVNQGDSVVLSIGSLGGVFSGLIQSLVSSPIYDDDASPAAVADIQTEINNLEAEIYTLQYGPGTDSVAYANEQKWNAIFFNDPDAESYWETEEQRRQGIVDGKRQEVAQLEAQLAEITRRMNIADSNAVTFARTFLKKRVVGSNQWTEVSTFEGVDTATYDADHPTQGAIQLAFGVEARHNRGLATMTLTGNPTKFADAYDMTLDILSPPNLSWGATQDACYVDDVILITTTGDSIGLRDMYMLDEDLTINCLTQDISVPSNIGPYYNSDEGGILPTNPAGYLPLPSGESVAWQNFTAAVVEFEYVNRWLV